MCIRDRYRGASLIIWANHSMRASVTAMQAVTAQIYSEQSITNVEKKVSFTIG